MKQLLLIPVFIALLASGLWFTRHHSPAAVPKPALKGTNIIAFGDSLVAGYGGTPGHDFPSLIGAELGAPVINAGKNGDTTASALMRIDTDVLARDPKIVIVLLGGNDFLHRTLLADTIKNLTDIIDRIQAKGAGVVLVGFNPDAFTDYDRAYRTLAASEAVSYVPNVLQDILGQPGLMSDYIHPNDKGYAMMAERIAPAVQALLRD
jgi:acyl-CoA thioesterase-1